MIKCYIQIKIAVFINLNSYKFPVSHFMIFKKIYLFVRLFVFFFVCVCNKML